MVSDVDERLSGYKPPDTACNPSIFYQLQSPQSFTLYMISDVEVAKINMTDILHVICCLGFFQTKLETRSVSIFRYEIVRRRRVPTQLGPFE